MALLKVLLLLLLLGVSVNSGVSLQKRIIGGHNCDNHQRLHHVRIFGSNGTKTTMCGGSLIHPQWILTAAHCWVSEPGWIFTAAVKVHPLTANQKNLEIQNNPVIFSNHGQDHDIMVIKIPRPVRDVTPAQLPNCKSRLKIDDTVQLAGEGPTGTGPNNQRSTSSLMPLRLQCVNMKVVAVSQFHQKRGHTFLAKAPGKDMCYGDFGGGVMFNDMIYGVISTSGNDACQKPVRIMDVCEYMDWIKKRTGLK